MPYDLPERMRILQITAPEKPVWMEAPLPKPGPGQVLVRVTGITTCPHWDMRILGGTPMFGSASLTYPYTPGEPGHEAVGEVVAVGPGVDKPPVGSTVAAWRDRGKRTQGCYAQFVALHADDLIVVPASLLTEQIASLELAMCVQVSFDQLNKVDGIAGKRVAISGMGPAGLIAVQMARAYGADEIVSIDPVEVRRQLSTALGATMATHPDELPTGRAKPAAFDSGLDTTGLKVAIEHLIDRTVSAVAIFGVLREPVCFGPKNWWGGFCLMGYGAHNRAAAERALGLIVDGKLRLDPLVSCRLPLSSYAEGVARLRSKEAVKVLFDPWA